MFAPAEPGGPENETTAVVTHLWTPPTGTSGPGVLSQSAFDLMCAFLGGLCAPLDDGRDADVDDESDDDFADLSLLPAHDRSPWPTEDPFGRVTAAG